jgi:hypothetical protein
MSAPREPRAASLPGDTDARVARRLGLVMDAWRQSTPRWMLVLALAGAGASSSAQVYKCVGADGHVEFNNRGCPTGVTSQSIPATPNTLDMSGARRQDLLAEVSRRQSEQARAGRTGHEAVRRGAPGRCAATPPPAPPTTSAPACSAGAATGAVRADPPG